MSMKPLLLQVDPTPVTITQLFDDVRVELTELLELITLPPLAMIRELPDPASPKIKFPVFVQNDPDPVTVTEFPKEFVELAIVVDPLNRPPPFVIRMEFPDETLLSL